MRKVMITMSALTKETIDMMEMLPESEQSLINEFVKRVVLAWDPDYTKVTPREAADMKRAEEEFVRGETVSHEDIDWD